MFDIELLHQLACKEGRDTYIDPHSGFHVMTRNANLNKGTVVVMVAVTILMDILMLVLKN
jgi:hypothetical protein